MLAAVASVVEEERRAAARSVNTVMTATSWEIGRRIGAGNGSDFPDDVAEIAA